MINERTLIDNSSEALSMKTTLHECITREGISEIRIATGYWDMPGMTLIYNELKAFLEKDGTVLKLLIGKDPYVYANQIKNPIYKDHTYPNDYIRTDISNLEFTEEYENVVKLLLDYCAGDDSKFKIKLYNLNYSHISKKKSKESL